MGDLFLFVFEVYIQNLTEKIEKERRERMRFFNLKHRTLTRNCVEIYLHEIYHLKFN